MLASGLINQGVSAYLTQSERIRSRGGKAGLLKEVRGVRGEGIAGKILHSPHHADNLGTAPINTLEAVHVGCASRRLTFQGSGVGNHGNSVVDIEISFSIKAGEAQETLPGLCNPALTDEPPGRLGSEEDDDYERNRPHPLQSVGNAERPLIVTGKHRLDHTNTDELTETPADVDVGSQVTTQGNGDDFRGVGDGECLEDTPWNTGQNLANLEGNDGLRSEENGDEAGQEREGHDESPPVAEFVRGPTIDHQTDDFANVDTVAETRLPCCRDLVIAIGKLLAEFPVELGESVEVRQQTGLVALEDC